MSYKLIMHPTKKKKKKPTAGGTAHVVEASA
jgi:hypothetical protein